MASFNNQNLSGDWQESDDEYDVFGRRKRNKNKENGAYPREEIPTSKKKEESEEEESDEDSDEGDLSKYDLDGDDDDEDDEVPCEKIWNVLWLQ